MNDTHIKNNSKKCKYVREREEIINKIDKLIGLSENKNFVYLFDIENDENCKNEIKKMISDIIKYYKCGHWGYFSKESIRGMGNITSLIRAIYKDDGYVITTKKKIIERNNEKKSSTVYFIIKNKGF